MTKTRHKQHIIVALTICIATLGLTPCINAATISDNLQKVSRESADASQGFAAGTTGGSKADSSHTYQVSNRTQLLSALGNEQNYLYYWYDRHEY